MLNQILFFHYKDLLYEVDDNIQNLHDIFDLYKLELKLIKLSKIFCFQNLKIIDFFFLKKIPIHIKKIKKIT